MAVNRVAAQPWIHSARMDLLFIVGPAFLVTLLAILLSAQLQSLGAMSAWVWLVLIVGVDVTHVYSTLFRTYFDREELRQRQGLYLLTPLLAWVAGSLLYSMGSLVFWRVLAYLAVFHFVRQQYGFMMIYGRRDERAFKWIDKVAIYAATLYPLIYWHAHERHFDWFVDGDFFLFRSDVVIQVAGWCYGGLMMAYFLKEAWLWRRSGWISWPKQWLLAGTALSWYVGIVQLDNDLIFSAINVISHGVPYLALIWIYGRNQSELQGKEVSYSLSWVGELFRRRWWWLFLGLLACWAYIEENLWDGWIWREHGSVLLFADALPEVHSEQVLIWLVPLLATPQVTHYVLDAFIWRMQHPDTNWGKILFLQANKR